MAASRAGPRSRLGLACGAVRPGRLAAASAARNQPQGRRPTRAAGGARRPAATRAAGVVVGAGAGHRRLARPPAASDSALSRRPGPAGNIPDARQGIGGIYSSDPPSR
jgi:hypothetical protein